MRRIVAPIIGLLLIGVVVDVGVRATNDPHLVVWFGLVSAILAPTGIALIAEGFRGGDAKTLEDLRSVTEIETLIAQAGSERERLTLLERERANLDEIVRLEARAQTLGERQRVLLDEARRVLGELELVDREAASLRVDIASSAALPEIQALETRLAARRRGDLVLRIGSRTFIVPSDTPFATTNMLVKTATTLLDSFDRFVRRRR